MLKIYVDADACPVKQEVYKVARRCKLPVFIVSNSFIKIPSDSLFQSVTVGDGEDEADNWIAEHIQKNDICITADIPLAARCLEVGAFSLSPRGKPFSEDSIGEALATRDLLSTLRESGMIGTGGPPPLTPKDRSQFLNVLDQIIQKIRRENK